MRKIEFKNGEYYHIYNRGVEKRDIFLNDFDYLRFLKALNEFNRVDSIGSIFEQGIRDKKTTFGHPVSKLVEINAYCINPNHYHLILRQLQDKGIEKFMHKVGMGYAKYFNHKYKHSGVVFQGGFQAIHIDSNEYLLYLSVYVNKNNFIHGYGKNDWKYSSVLDYLGKRKDELCSKDVVLGQFKSIEEYKEFMEVNALHLKEKKEMEKYLLEE
ncbi:MAG: transposase [Parcubacteria group bacterium]|jgi:putative transposase